MYTALIADDEEIIRRGIRTLLEQDSDFQVVATAEDGDMALEAVREHVPDLLFVDINMPFVSGLEFIERLGDAAEDAVIVIITGYDNFDYAKKALQLGVFDYLLKPVMEDAFYATLDRAKARLDGQRRQRKYLQWAREQLRRDHSSLLADFLHTWLTGELTDTEVDERIDFLDITLPSPFAVSAYHFTLREPSADPQKCWDDDLLYYAVENIALECFAELAPVCTCKNRRGDLVLISAARDDLERDRAGELARLLEANLPVSVEYDQVAGETYQDIPAAYDRVRELVLARSRESATVRQTKAYIHAHYHEQDFSLQQTAEHLHITPQHLSRQFKRETGSTFMEYVTHCRLQQAVALLSGDWKLYEIAQRSGYSTQHYFSSAFKKALGISPQEYRRIHCQGGE